MKLENRERALEIINEHLQLENLLNITENGEISIRITIENHDEGLTKSCLIPREVYKGVIIEALNKIESSYRERIKEL